MNIEVNIFFTSKQAIQDITDCRTEVMGGHVFACNHCEQLRYAHHSCKNRSCPTCHEADRKAWLEKRRQERLPAPYFHAVFMLPKELHEIIESHQKIGYALIMEAAALSLMKLASDARYVGGQIGILAILHAWTRALVYHPHVHCLIPAGGLSPDRRYWLDARKNYLVPVKALSEMFRATFMALIRKKLPQVKNLFPELTACGLTVLPQMSSCVHRSEYCPEKRLLTPFFINSFTRYNVLMIKIMELPLDFSQILPYIFRQISKQND